MAWYVALGLWTIIVCSNDDDRLTLTYFTARSNLVSYASVWGKLLESHLMEETYSDKKVLLFMFTVYKNSDPRFQSFFFFKLATNGQSDLAFLLTSGFCPQRVVSPCPGAIYMWNNIKNVYKIRIQRDLIETFNKWSK